MVNQKKAEKVKALKELVNFQDCLLIANFNGLSAAAITELRKKIRETSGLMFVAKNTLMDIAVTDTKHEGIKPYLVKESAFIIAGKDVAAIVKALYDFSNENQQLTIKGGVLNGKLLTKEQVIELAKMPPREVMIVMLLGTMNVPIAGFANVLAGTIRKFMYALNAIKEQKEQA